MAGWLRGSIVAVVLMCAAQPAAADVTAFIGANTTPANRLVGGVAVGVTLLVVGFEFEYCETRADLLESAPGLRTGMGNVFVQNPIPIAGAQVYLTAGGGVFREELAQASTTSVGVNTGGGVKIELVSHLKLRVDYRFFRLAAEAKEPNVHRVYVGLNLAF